MFGGIMKLIEQIDDLNHKLELELKKFSINEKFYSVREIMNKFSVNRRIVDGSLVELEQKGLIRIEKRIGVFCNTTGDESKTKILLVVPDWPSHLFNEWEEKLTQCAEHKNATIRKLYYDNNISLCTQLPKGGYDILLLRWSSRDFPLDMLSELSKRAEPTIVFGSSLGELAFNYVVGDNEFAATQACLFLHKLHHKKVLLLLAEPFNESSRQIVTAFQSMASIIGMDCTFIDCNTTTGESSSIKAYETMNTYLSKCNGKIDFSAIFTTSGVVAEPVMTSLREAGFSIPEDVGILSISSSTCGKFFHPALSVISISVEEQAEAVFDGIDFLLKNPYKIFRKKVSAKIIKRDSLLQYEQMNNRKT